jgi:hypothetical protein
VGTTINRNEVLIDVRRRHSGNDCYYSVQKLLSYRLLYGTVNTRTYKIIILPLFCMDVKLGLLLEERTQITSV